MGIVNRTVHVAPVAPVAPEAVPNTALGEPQITVSILSWMLEDRLIKTLRGIPASTKMPLNLCCHVQGEELLCDAKKYEILDAASGFVNKDIYFTKGNAGTTAPRLDLMGRSAITPFILITDNDIDFKPDSIDRLYEFMLDKANYEYAFAILAHNQQRYYLTRDQNGNCNYIPIELNRPRVVDTDITGAASMLLRSEIALIPNILDTRYHIGAWDWDFCANLRSMDWKIATIIDERYMVRNDRSYQTREYRSVKYGTVRFHENRDLFKRKWGFFCFNRWARHRFETKQDAASRMRQLCRDFHSPMNVAT